ncbi:MAG: helix-turn-helix domain-containing protein, partial [Bacteroidaceae bacterium]|nr:helix-turn-helix domain-containing protein [Bacteroidaceae bacterium]
MLGRFYHRYSDVAFYAEQLGVSARYLGQVTRSIAQRSPKAMIDERITEEITQLLTTNKPLKEIAQMLGFSSQAHLSRFFKKQKGQAPSALRQK